MDSKKLNSALSNIELWLSKQMLYYSANLKKYFIGYYAGMGNFDVNELPNEYQDLFISCELVDEQSSHLVLSQLSLISKKTPEIMPYTASLARVISSDIYGYEHDTGLISAIRFASIKHKNQKRKASGEPYINHLLEVVQLIKFFEPTSNEATLIAATLHDIIEDTGVIIESIEFLFGSEVSELVTELTCDSLVNSDHKKSILLEQITAGSDQAKVIKLADVISNVSSIPNQWSIAQKQKYLSWCKQVANVCAVASPRLYENFQQIVDKSH